MWQQRGTGIHAMADPAMSSGGDIKRSETTQIQVRFVPRDTPVRVPSDPFSVPLGLDSAGLSKVVNALAELDPARDFEFLAKGLFLEGSLQEYVEAQRAAGAPVEEQGVVLEFTEAMPEPEQGPVCAHPDWVSALDGSLGNDRLVSGCYDGVVRLFAGADLKDPVATTVSHAKPVKAVTAFRCAGSARVASASQDGTARVWCVSDGSDDDGQVAFRPLCECVGHSRGLECVASLPGRGDTLATAGWDTRVMLWTIPPEDDAVPAPGTKRRRRENEKSENNAPSFRSIEPLAQFEGAKGAVTDMCWPHPLAIYTCGQDRAIRLWDAKTGANTAIWNGKAAFTSLSFGLESANLIATAHTDCSICLWDPRQREKSVIKLQMRGHKGWVTQVSWRPGSARTLVSTGHDGSMRVWDARSTRPLHTIRAHQDKGLCVGWWGKDCVVSGGADKRISAHVLRESGAEEA